MHKIIEDDLENILNQTFALWEELRGQRLFITGGTGFFGTWLLHCLVAANQKFQLGIQVVVLTRDPEKFAKHFPYLNEGNVLELYPGDVRHFAFPQGNFSHIIHAAATSAEETFRNEDPIRKVETVINGTKRVLDFAVKCGAKKILYTSSGAAYGKQPDCLSRLPETYVGAPDITDPGSVWGESKRMAEMLCCQYNQAYGLEVKIARCFSFVGPFLPLKIHYAIGNFIRDGLNGKPITVNGDGTTRRSYLYTSDLMVWLWTILFNGKPSRLYNVGSGHDVSIAELARTVSDCLPNRPPVTIKLRADLSKTPDRYIPSTIRVTEELGLKKTVPLKDAIQKTIRFYSDQLL